MRKTTFDVTLRHSKSGQEKTHMIIADNAERATAKAVRNARNVPGKMMAERLYDRFEVVSCKAR